MYPNNKCKDCPPCPEPITPVPLPDLSDLCGNLLNTKCVIYTGPAIDCLGITPGMTFVEILSIFQQSLEGCGCCEKQPTNCVYGEWSEWSACAGTPPVQTRTKYVVTPASNGGTCEGPIVETRCCPVDCDWEWSEWSVCDPDTSTQTRTVIINSEPICGGGACPTVLEETRSCVPDIDCVVEWGPWSDCVSGTRTRTGVIVTPSSGDGATCPDLFEIEVCATPFCLPPTNVIAIQVRDHIEVSFDTVSGADDYTLYYSSDGGATYTDITLGFSPFIFPAECGTAYEGYIVTNCTNTLTSSQVPFTVVASDCEYCPGESSKPIAAGGFNSPTGLTVYLDSVTMNTTYFGTNKPLFAGSSRVTSVVKTPMGYAFAGNFSTVFYPNPGGTNFTVNGLALYDCKNVLNNTFFGSGVTRLQVSTYVTGDVYAMVYDENTNRFFIGGTFTRYKGVACTPNFICIDGTTGNIAPNANFAISGVGINSSVTSIHIQSDGKILVGGTFTSAYGDGTKKYIVRFLTNGVIDSTFNPGTSVNFTTSPTLTAINAITTDTTGNIYIGGIFNTCQSSTRICVAKLYTNGSIVPGFDAGLLVQNSSGFYLQVTSLTLQGNQLLITGGFDRIQTYTCSGLARVSASTGAIDLSFTRLGHTGTITMAWTVKLWNNKILFGHAMASLGTSTSRYYHILDANGNIDPSMTSGVAFGTSGDGIRTIETR